VPLPKFVLNIARLNHRPRSRISITDDPGSYIMQISIFLTVSFHTGKNQDTITPESGSSMKTLSNPAVSQPQPCEIGVIPKGHLLPANADDHL